MARLALAPVIASLVVASVRAAAAQPAPPQDAAPAEAGAEASAESASAPATASAAPAAGKAAGSATPAPAAPPAPATPAGGAAASSAAAQPVGTRSRAKAIQFFRDSKRATLEFSAPAPATGTVTLTSPAGEACEGQIVSANGSRASAEFPNCSNFSEFKTDSAVELVPVEATAPKVAGPTQEEEPPQARPAQWSSLKQRIRFAVRAGWDSGNELKFRDLKATPIGGSTYTGDLTYKTDSAASVAAEAVVSEPYSWGASVGVAFETPRRLRSASLNLAGVNFANNAGIYGEPTIAIFAGYGNLVYRWQSVYVMGGLSLLAPVLTNVPPALDGLGGGFGLQAGVGGCLSERTALEFLLKARAFGSKSQTFSGVTYDLGAGQIPSAELSIKFFL